VKKIALVLVLISLAASTIFTLRPLLFPQSLIPQITPTPLPSSAPSPQVTLIAVGDLMLGRSVNLRMLKEKNWQYPFLQTAKLLSSADLTFGNLESPLVSSCPPAAGGMTFCAPPEAAAGLTAAGFDVLSIANNHILNYGQRGRTQTMKFLNQNHILPSGPDQLAKYSVKKLTFGFLSFDLTGNHQPEPILKKVKESAPEVDILIVSLHWGVEYQNEPDIWQKMLARQIIEAGAKVVLGHHPHVVQPTETYQNGLIFYSLGNFVFDQDWSEETKRGKIVKIIFENKKIKSYEEIPIYIENNSQPRLIE